MNALVFCSFVGLTYTAITLIISILLGGLSLILLGIEGNLANTMTATFIAGGMVNFLVGACFGYIIDDIRHID